MSAPEYIALSTQSVGVGPGMFHAPDRPLCSEPNHAFLVARFETRRHNVHARVSLRLVLSFVSVRPPHQSAAISHRRVAIVNYVGVTILDHFVKPTLPVSDYRTNVTGILAGDLGSSKCRAFIDASTPCVLKFSLDNALTFEETQQSVALIIADKIIVGHSLWNDLSGALLSLPAPFPPVVLIHV